jgi:myo-inositol 2-dehydrogenase / D-chiro-inositol 1-dehydrogenase
MGATHARALAGDPEIELAALVEPSDAAAAALPTLPRRTIGELAGDVDGAIVAVPTRFHEQVVAELLDAGLHTLCEKPCGLASDATRRLAERAAATGRVLQVGYWRRFVPSLRELRERLLSGELGELELVHCAQWDETPPPAAFRDPTSSGGIVVDMAVHELDQLRWLTGQEVVSLAGAASSVTYGEPVPGDPESVVLTAELSGGALAIISLLRRYPPGDLCRIDLVAGEAAERLDFVEPGDGEAAFLAALRAQAVDFGCAIAGGEPAGATAEDAAVALELAERARDVLNLRPAPR